MFFRVYQRGTAAAAEPVEDTDLWAQERSQPFVIISRKAWRPPIDIYETPDGVVIKMELAGVREGDLDIAVTGEVLTVRGTRRDEAARRKIGYHHMGIVYGEFACDISLPGPVDRDSVTAEYDAGFLTITLPKARPQRLGPVQVLVHPHS